MFLARKGPWSWPQRDKSGQRAHKDAPLWPQECMEASTGIPNPDLEVSHRSDMVAMAGRVERNCGARAGAVVLQFHVAEKSLQKGHTLCRMYAGEGGRSVRLTRGHLLLGGKS